MLGLVVAEADDFRRAEEVSHDLAALQMSGGDEWRKLTRGALQLMEAPTNGRVEDPP
jgi:hypothetical protein